MDEEISAEEATIRALEEGMWRMETRFATDWLRDRLHPDFVEFGQSGRVYDRDAMLAGLTAPPSAIDCELPLANFRATRLEQTVWLVTYDSHVRYDGWTQHGHRSSVWVLHDGIWRMRLHQGTPFDPETPSERPR